MTSTSLQPELRDTASFSRIKGFYCLTGLITQINEQGQPYWELTLSDAYTSLVVISLELDNVIDKLQPFSFVHLEAKRIDNIAPKFKADFIYPVNEIPRKYRKLSLLPYPAVIDKTDLEALIAITETISIPSLKTFINQTLMQGRVMLPFLRNPASITYHHNFVGGLLKHSIAVAHTFIENCHLSTEEKELGIVGALLHDIGKTQTLNDAMQYTATGSIINHDALTLELCAVSLYILAQSNPRYADILRHIWTCSSPREVFGFKPKVNIAIQVQKADRINAFEF